MKHRILQVALLATLFAAAAVAAEVQAQSGPAGRTLGPDYVIGVEDELHIVVWGEKDLTQKVMVRPDGKITVPLINDVIVAGLTSEEVREKLTSSLGAFLREPNVTVIVTKLNSYRIYFLGEIRRPGALNFYRPTRLLQAIAAAGGLTDYGNKILILREENGEEKRVELDYKKVENGTQENIFLLAGDTVILP